jgi:hypothetical protein
MKRQYQKPEVRRVKLVPSESVLQGCKAFFMTGAGGVEHCIVVGRADPCLYYEQS